MRAESAAAELLDQQPSTELVLARTEQGEPTTELVLAAEQQQATGHRRKGTRLTAAELGALVDAYLNGAGLDEAARAAGVSIGCAHKRLRALGLIRSRSEANAMVHARARPAPPPRPKTRADCSSGPRPCPWVSCRHHLAIHIARPHGPRSEPEVVQIRQRRDAELAGATCSLDLVDQHPGGLTLDQVASLVDHTRERVRQIEAKAMGKLRAELGADQLAELLGVGAERAARGEQVEPIGWSE